MASLCASGTVIVALTRPLSYSPQMTIVRAGAASGASRAVSSLSIASGQSAASHACQPGFYYLPVYLGLDAPPHVESLLPSRVVDEGSDNQKRLIRSGDRNRGVVQYPDC